MAAPRARFVGGIRFLVVEQARNQAGFLRMLYIPNAANLCFCGAGQLNPKINSAHQKNRLADMFDILRVNGSECGEGLSCEALLPPLSQYVKFNSTVISGRLARVVTAPLLVVTQNRTI